MLCFTKQDVASASTYCKEAVETARMAVGVDYALDEILDTLKKITDDKDVEDMKDATKKWASDVMAKLQTKNVKLPKTMHNMLTDVRENGITPE